MSVLQVLELKQSLARRDERILELEREIEEMKVKTQERGEAVALTRQALFDLIAGTDAPSQSSYGDNVAVALCSYFENHLDRPENDEPASDEHCWGPWVEEQYAATVYAIADRILEAHPTPDTGRVAELNRPVAKNAHHFELCRPGDRQQRIWLLMFDDADRGHSVFDDEEEAYREVSRADGGGWNCHLFVSAPRDPANYDARHRQP